jgi:hypothetical protein
LEFRPPLINDEQALRVTINSDSVVGLKHLLDQLDSDGVLEISAKISEEEQTFLHDSYIRLLQNTYVRTYLRCFRSGFSLSHTLFSSLIEKYWSLF